MENRQNPEFLRQKYQLDKSPEVEKAVQKKELQGERVRNVPENRIQAYLDRLDLVFNPPELKGHPNFDRKARNLSMMKRFMHEALIVKPDVVTDGYIKHEQQMARERGYGDIEAPDYLRNRIATAVEAIANGADITKELSDFRNEEKQMVEEIIAKIEEQKTSLDHWLEYLASDDATYPDWLKYWTMRSVVGLSSYDKDEKRFPSRDATTTNPFPDLNREALAYVLDAAEKDVAYKQKLKASQEELKRAEKKHNKARQQAIATRIAEIKRENPSARIDRKQIMEEIDLAPFDVSRFETQVPEDRRDVEPKLQQALDAQDFAKLYAWAIEKVTPAAENVLYNTQGAWVKYGQGADHMPLVESLQGHGTGWCTAGEATAQSQLSRGDFFVYYSQDEDGQDTVPRAAIRMEGDSIAEVRGIAQDHNLDPHIGEVVQSKMSEFPDGVVYEKKASDMKQLTDIERKVQAGQQLYKDELIFLYEINGSIEGFGYQRDPRIQELRDARDLKADMPIVFECELGQIARTPDQINEGTKAYVGPLELGIFSKIAEFGIEHIYTIFPERRILRQTVEVGGKTKEQLLNELQTKGVKIVEFAKKMMENSDFVTSSEAEDMGLIRLSVADLNIQGSITIDAVYARAQELGLELVPPDAGPAYCLATLDQSMDGWVCMGMKQIAGLGGYPFMFGVERIGGDQWLLSFWAHPSRRWSPDGEFLFRLRKSET